MKQREIKSVESMNEKRINALRELRKISGNNYMFLWDARYSETDEPDKFGRWQRLCFIEYNDGEFLLIGHYNKVDSVFNYHTEFPVSGNMNPQFSDICYTSSVAEEMIELLFIEFNYRIRNPFNPLKN